jgi:hypothetical protein
MKAGCAAAACRGGHKDCATDGGGTRECTIGADASASVLTRGRCTPSRDCAVTGFGAAGAPSAACAFGCGIGGAVPRKTSNAGSELRICGSWRESSGAHEYDEAGVSGGGDNTSGVLKGLEAAGPGSATVWAGAAAAVAAVAGCGSGGVRT